MVEQHARRTHEVQYVTLHGHRRAYVKVGSGPALLLLHGLGCDHTTWEPVIDTLARRYTVIAPDLLGHGRSAKPRADYSVGGYANGMRDLITLLGIDKVTVVGHSFGGGVAMQFAYQFPERTERMILVGSGGLGPEVSPAIRAITTPGFHQVMGLLTLPGVRHLGKAGLKALSRTGLKATRDLDEVAEIYDSFRDPYARAAIRHVVRAVVDWRGQIVTMARPRLPHRGDADGGHLGPRRPGDPGPARLQRRRPRTEGPRRGDPERRALPAQGPPAAVRQGSSTSSSAPPSRRRTHGPGSARLLKNGRTTSLSPVRRPAGRVRLSEFHRVPGETHAAPLKHWRVRRSFCGTGVRQPLVRGQRSRARPSAHRGTGRPRRAG